MLIFMAQPENIYSLWCPIKRQRGSAYFFGSLQTVHALGYETCGLLRVGSIACVTSPTQDSWEKNSSCSQAGSIYGENLHKCKRGLVLDGGGEPITCLVCVCSRPSRPALGSSLRIPFLFLGVIQAQEESPWWVNESPSTLNHLSCVSH